MLPDVSSLFTSTVLGSKKPFVAYFTASWCGPCRAFGPLVEAAAEEHPEISFGKVDVDSAPALAGKYGVRSVPTLLLFKEGKPVAQSSGLLTKDKLVEFIQK
jgi:thioredoxin